MSRKFTTAVVTIMTLAVAAAFTPAALAERYVVLYKGGASISKAGDWIERSGGTVVANYGEIGVVIARSSSPTFAQAMKGGAGIDTVAVSRAVAKVDVPDTSPGDLPNAPATEDSLAARQWDMRQIHTPEAHAITGGSPAVVVGDIDTGLDKDHPGSRRQHRLRTQRVVRERCACHDAGGVGRPRRPRHAHGGHDRGRVERLRDHRRRSARQDRRDQVVERRRLLLRRHGHLLVHVGGLASDRRDQQQLLHGPVPLQLPDRPRAAGALEGGQACDRLRAEAGRHGRCLRGERVGRSVAPAGRRDQPRLPAGE
jgi:hypothetical protein